MNNYFNSVKRVREDEAVIRPSTWQPATALHPRLGFRFLLLHHLTPREKINTPESLVPATSRLSKDPSMSTSRIPSAACSSISSTANQLAFNLRRPSCSVLPGNARLLGRHKCSRGIATVAMASAKTDPLEICVKASVTTPNKLGDCEIVFVLLHFSVPACEYVSFHNAPWNVGRYDYHWWHREVKFRSFELLRWLIQLVDVARPLSA